MEPDIRALLPTLILRGASDASHRLGLMMQTPIGATLPRKIAPLAVRFGSTSQTSAKADFWRRVRWLTLIAIPGDRRSTVAEFSYWLLWSQPWRSLRDGFLDFWAELATIGIGRAARTLMSVLRGCPRSGRSAIVKSFGRRQAYESPRGRESAGQKSGRLIGG